MLRAITKSKLPIWYTEGFNVHPYITFPLPLSLGFRGKKECMDLRITDDDYDISGIADMLNPCLPSGIRVLCATYPIKKTASITSASFHIKLTSDDISLQELYKKLTQLLSSPEILVEKKTKKGIKTVDIKQYFSSCKAFVLDDCVSVRVVLPAGSSENINPTLLIKAFESSFSTELCYDITRTDTFDEEGKSFE